MSVPHSIDLCVAVSVNPDGTLRVSDGATQVTRTAEGSYTLTFGGEFPASELLIMPAVDSPPGVGLPSPATDPSVGTILVNTFDAGGALADQGWTMLVYRVLPQQ